MTWGDIENRVQDIIRGVHPAGNIPADVRQLLRQIVYRQAYYELALEEAGIKTFDPARIPR